ncbi:MAG: zinc ribbon domain-containing protein [Arachnia sp.]
MHADPVDQRRLLTLADLDSELSRLQHTARTLPEHAVIAERMAERERVADELVAVSTRVDDLGVAVSRAESDLVPVRARLGRDEQRAGDGSITDPKTLQELLTEIERIKSRIVELEDAELEVMGQLEQAQAEHTELAARRDEIEATLREQVAARDARVAELKAEARDVAQTRAATAKQEPEALLKLYERLRSHTGMGAAVLKAGRCTGCQLELTLADLDAYRKAPVNEVLRCVECDRILVRTGPTQA